AGDTINVRGGTYREEVSVYTGGGSAGKYVTLQAYGSEKPVLKGSELVTGWTLYSGKIWKKSNWTYNSQQVFVDLKDGPSLKQIGMPSSYYTSYEYPKKLGSGVSSMVAGSFYYDAGQKALYVWLPDGSSPNNHQIEASTKKRILYLGKPYIYIKNIAFRHSSSSAFIKQGSAVELSSNSVMDHCDVQYADFTGVSMGYLQTGAQLINSNISNNGNSGINMPGSYNFRVAGNKINNNNTRNFYQLWHAGGIKAASKAYGKVEFNEVAYNNATGVWFDYANGGNQIIVRNNYIHNNGPMEAAIFMEASKNGLIYNNVITNNERRGIYISASNSMKVYNNTVYGTKTHAGIEVNGMPRSGQTLTGNSVYNNIISNTSGKYDLYIASPNGSSISNNTSNYNVIYRSSGSPQLMWGSSLQTSLANWSKLTSQDKNSQVANPLFTNPSSSSTASNWAVQSSSPAVNKGMSISAVPEDYSQKKRPSGAAYDVGAYENGSSTSTSTATSSTGPSIQMSSPSKDGASVSGSVSIASTASDSDGIASMKVYVDGVLKKSSTTNAISYSWSTSGQRIGTHYIMISATDTKNNSTRFTRSVSVTGSTASTSTSTTTASSGSTTSSGPVVSVSSPSADGALVRGTVSIVASATGLIKRMAIYVDGALKHSTTGNSISYSWNSSGLRIGSHQILISATDHENKWARLVRTVKVY
ncbi:MAG TPA: Ig-like domain-containing protein, partial [Methylophilaceae bacterium]|nr:Ig-like domain-containing protein [Methylophilaceae bacterium]